MRAFYLWNGGSPHDVDNILMSDAMSMWKMYQYGMVGPLQHYIPAYNNYAMQHNAAQTYSKSKKKPETFEKVFKPQLQILKLQDPSERQTGVTDDFWRLMGPKRG